MCGDRGGPPPPSIAIGWDAAQRSILPSRLLRRLLTRLPRNHDVLRGSRALLGPHARAEVRRRELLGYLPGKKCFLPGGFLLGEGKSPSWRPCGRCTAGPSWEGRARTPVFMSGMGSPSWFGINGPKPTNLVFVQGYGYPRSHYADNMICDGRRARRVTTVAARGHAASLFFNFLLL